MASTLTSSGTSLNRKSLKRPDGFMATLMAGFRKVSERSSLFLLLAIGLLGLGLLVATIANRMQGQSAEARNALYSAQQTLATELKAIVTQEKLKSPEAVQFLKLNVDTQLSGSVKKLKAVAEEFGRTRSAFEARLKLGDLYYQHGDSASAVSWYEKAISSAPGNFEKALSLSSLGYTYEKLGKPSDAAASFEKALNLGEESLRGDLLLSLARSYEALHNSEKARSTYDKIITDLHDTDYAKTAELYKSQLK